MTTPTPVIVWSDVEITRDNLGTSDRFVYQLRTWADATGDERLADACHAVLQDGDAADPEAMGLVLRELNARRRRG